MRKCAHCGYYKAASEFYRDRVLRNGRHKPYSQCRMCLEQKRKNRLWQMRIAATIDGTNKLPPILDGQPVKPFTATLPALPLMAHGYYPVTCAPEVGNDYAERSFGKGLRYEYEREE